MIGNNWTGIGRITDDLVLKKTTSGKDTLTFTLAVDKRNKKQLEQEGKPSANFIRCVAWEYNARLLSNYCTKGKLIALEGNIETRNYKDTDGKTVYVTEVIVETVKFIDKPNQTSQPSNAFETVDDLIEEERGIESEQLPF